MTALADQLVEQLGSDEGDVPGLALGKLITMGSEATPSLLEALENPDPRVRALAAEGLGRIGDSAAADRLFAALADEDEAVRSQSAAALAYLDDPRAPDALIGTLADNYDLLQANLTLSAYALSSYGPEILPAIAPLLKHEDGAIRTQAIWIIVQIVSNMVSADEDWTDFWRSLGSYDPEGQGVERDHSADLWTAWISSRVGDQS